MAAKLVHPLLHSGNADPQAARAPRRGPDSRHPLTLIRDDEDHRRHRAELPLPGEGDLYRRAAGVTMHVGQGFLRDPEQRRLNRRRQAVDLG